MAENCIVPIHMERRNSDCEYVCDQPDGDFSTSTLQGHGGGEGGGEDSPCSYENITLLTPISGPTTPHGSLQSL